jgi:two-component system KDP operon response regulator KdpE
VEDEPQMRRFLRASLASHGFQVLEAANGREAAALVSSRNPDAVLLDLGLPDGDGIALTRNLREWTSVPVIVISARGKEEDKVTALDAGADDYLTKPFGLGELLARIRVVLRRGRAGEPAIPPRRRATSSTPSASTPGGGRSRSRDNPSTSPPSSTSSSCSWPRMRGAC